MNGERLKRVLDAIDEQRKRHCKGGLCAYCAFENRCYLLNCIYFKIQPL